MLKLTDKEKHKIEIVSKSIKIIDRIIEDKRKSIKNIEDNIESFEKAKYKQEQIISKIEDRAVKRCRHVDTYRRTCHRDDCITGWHETCRECGKRI